MVNLPVGARVVERTGCLDRGTPWRRSVLTRALVPSAKARDQTAIDDIRRAGHERCAWAGEEQHYLRHLLRPAYAPQGMILAPLADGRFLIRSGQLRPHREVQHRLVARAPGAGTAAAARSADVH